MLSLAVAGEATAQGLGLIAGAFCARLLGVQDFGRYGLILATVQLLVNWGTAAQQVTVSRHAGLWIIDAPDRSGRVIALGLLVTAVASGSCALALFLGAPLVATALGDQGLAALLRLSAVMIPSMACTVVVTSALNGTHSQRSLPIAGLARGGFTALGLTIGANFGLTGVVVGMVVANSAIIISLLVTLRRALAARNVRLDIRGSLAERSVFVSFSAPQIFASALAALAVWYSTRIVGASIGPGEVAGLTVARQWQGVLTFLPVTAAAILLPVLSSELRSRDGKYFATAHDLTMGAVLAASATIIFFTPMLLALYGHDYSQATTTVRWLVGGTAIGFLGNVLGAQVLARGDSWYSAFVNGIWSLALAISCAFFVPALGATGVGLSYAIAYTVALGLAATYLLRRGDLSVSQALRTVLAFVALAMVLLSAAMPGPRTDLWFAALAGVGSCVAWLVGPYIHGTANASSHTQAPSAPHRGNR